MDDNQSDGDGVCNTRKEAPSGTTNGKVLLFLTVSVKVTAFLTLVNKASLCRTQQTNVKIKQFRSRMQ